MINSADLKGKTLKLITSLIKYIWILVPVIIILYFLSVKKTFLLNNIKDREVDEYRKITIESLQSKVQTCKKYRGLSFIILDDKRKIWLPFSENSSYRPYLLCDFIHSGDSLVKRFKSDTVYVYRENKKYAFLLGETTK